MIIVIAEVKMEDSKEKSEEVFGSLVSKYSYDLRVILGKAL
jgi:hypothetical protein